MSALAAPPEFAVPPALGPPALGPPEAPFAKTESTSSTRSPHLSYLPARADARRERSTHPTSSPALPRRTLMCVGTRCGSTLSPEHRAALQSVNSDQPSTVPTQLCKLVMPNTAVDATQNTRRIAIAAVL
ncbi:MAG: hypothetical protein QM784_39120 [Polyangiaceae bacterium]